MLGVRIRLDKIMTEKNVGLTELSDRTGVPVSQLSVLRCNQAEAVRLSTLTAICKALACLPGDILEYAEDE